MRILQLGWLGLPLLVAACGGHSDSGVPTLSVSCGGNLALAGAASVTVNAPAGSAGTVMSFPDPVNAGQTGSLPVVQGRSCTITPVASGSGKSGTS